MAYSIVPRRFLVNRFFDDDWDDDIVPFSSDNGLSISEDDNNVYVEAAMPGIKAEDVEITFDKGMLWIKGESNETEEDKKKKYYQKSSSVFSYRVSVPGDIDMSKDPEAVCENGVMKISFTKSPESKPKKISVKSK